ncbi:hypothetical protein PLESTM_001655800 [Pleodorina starrii]|nr:hypothetical protein PLESTM_001655800 [Pleodorina starrii]
MRNTGTLKSVHHRKKTNMAPARGFYKPFFALLVLQLSAIAVTLLDQTSALPPRPRFVFGAGLREPSSSDAASNGKPFRVLQRPFGKIAKESLRKDLIGQCSERWRNATLDHFSRVTPAGGATTFPQRYFVCANHWRPRSPDGTIGPIFFYLGNEADVTLYLNNTGLMWESAPEFEAMLVFAEHRYYGESVPYGKNVRKHMGYLMAEQAMADYAELIMEVKEEFKAEGAAVIGFGGSYGGMLAAWMRLKYSHVLDGSIAASAPIWNFLGETPPFDSGSFARGVTYDATELAGSAPTCVDNVRKTWSLLTKYGSDDKGRSFLADALQLCPGSEPKNEDDVLLLREWLAAAWDMMAMGNFPYPSSYITNGHGNLPAFPVRVACSYLDASSPKDGELLAAMSSAVGVFYNHTGDSDCFDPLGGTDPDSDHDANFWDFQWCAEMLMPFSKDGVNDMFWDEPFEMAAAVAACEEHWGVTPRRFWATTEWGGRRIAAGSNIVFSNGLLDPWHGGGVLEDISDSMPAVIIPEGAHHLDLMFSHPDDPLSVIEVRKFQRDAIRDWIGKPIQPRNQVAAAAAVATAEAAAEEEEEEQEPQRRGRCGGMLGRLWRGARDWMMGVLGLGGAVGRDSLEAGGGGGLAGGGGRRWGEGRDGDETV